MGLEMESFAGVFEADLDMGETLTVDVELGMHVHVYVNVTVNELLQIKLPFLAKLPKSIVYMFSFVTWFKLIGYLV